ncbi:uncharacterized protein LOC122941999 [Bufo gargarizans]|uniref:uncharacterized protein LOC122941999 n=1 Tax=Bufo gargarizans TaxID=30331 RepID=UPI001CF49353|nr:uncharacterized protein LOC122941999 [Bufo gargarizans]
MAIADANYRFITVDIGAYGRTNNSIAFKNSAMERLLYSKDFRLPPPRPLPGTDGPPMPFVVVGDKSFQMWRTLSSRTLAMTCTAVARNKGSSLMGDDVVNMESSKVLQHTSGLLEKIAFCSTASNSFPGNNPLPMDRPWDLDWNQPPSAATPITPGLPDAWMRPGSVPHSPSLFLSRWRQRQLPGSSPTPPPMNIQTLVHVSCVKKQ